MQLTLILLVFGVPLALLIRSKIRSDQLRRETQPDSTDIRIGANTTETGHPHTICATKVPQKSAKISIAPDKNK